MMVVVTVRCADARPERGSKSDTERKIMYSGAGKMRFCDSHAFLLHTSDKLLPAFLPFFPAFLQIFGK